MRKNNHLPIHLFLLISMLLQMTGFGLQDALAQNRQTGIESTQAVFTVTTIADSGPGSLRQAILEANAASGADTITFAIGATGSQQTIQPASSLPSITDPVTIDGWSQGGAGYIGAPLIEINGGLTSGNMIGLNITAGSSVVRGLVINGFTGSFASGIRMQTGGGNWIYGNYIGTNFAGDTRIANQRGIWIEAGSSNNRIGTNADGVNDTAERNVISSNIDQNIWIYQPATTGNRIMGNYIGLNAAGTAAVGTSNSTVAAHGITVQEASYTVIGTDGDGVGDALEGNVIGGNTYNINLTGTSISMSHHNRVSGNLIGTNAAGTASVGLQVEGVRVYVTENNIIGTDGDGVSDALEGNLISGNSDWGILVQQTGALNNVIAGNKIGTDITGLSAIANGFGGAPRAGIYLGGYGNLVGSNFDGVSDELERNLISGNGGTASAILLQFVEQPGALPNAVTGNWMGVDATGLAALPNGYGISGASGSATGIAIRDNLISGHTYDGIRLNATASTLTGNWIGVGADGVTPLGNGYDGIYLTSGSNNQIGGTGPGEANIIAHNGATPYYSGIRLSNTALRNTIRGNRIFANSQLGIDLRWPDGVTLNDADDVDTGGNNLQNYPVISFAQAYADGTTVIQGTLDSNPNTAFTLDFYYSSEADDSGYGEGEFYLGESSVSTDANGDVTFDVTLPVTIPPNQFVTATATHADGSTSEFSLAYAAGGVADVPISGLAIQFTPPVYTDSPVQFVASVGSGTGVSYTWDFGDGGVGTGAVAEHTYTTQGIYTVTLTASNNSGTLMTSAEVDVLEPANINGMRWIDRDADGFFGMGEILNTVVTVQVTATLQEPPFTVLTAAIQNGTYQIFTPQAGIYQVEVADGLACSYIPNCISSPNPVTVAVGESGGVEVNFGILPVWFVQQPDDDGYIAGRAWIDSNANGYPEATETPLNNQTVRLYDSAGNLLTTTTTGASWGYGSYAFRISNPGVYRVQMDAPSGVFPASREVEVYVSDLRAVSAQLPFLAGGTIGGQVTGSQGTGLANVTLALQPGNLQTVTTADGSYSFSGLTDGNYTLQITPPNNYITPDGVTGRFVPAALNGSAVENWTLLKKGELTIRANQVVNGQALPISFLAFEVLLNDVQETVVFTNPQGEAVVEGLTPGTYTVRLWDVLSNLVPGLQLTPAERIAVVSDDTAATLNFSGTLSRSLNLYCQLAGTFGQGFACDYEVRTLNGSLVDFGTLPAGQPTTSNWNLNPATLEVRLIPDPDVPGQETWPTYSQIVVIADNTHVDVRYPWNPSNPQTIAGYAFWDRCAPQGTRANGNNCTETNVPSNNGIPVSLYNASGVEIASTLTTQGTGWNSGYFSFPNLPVPGSYRVRVNLPSGYAPTTAVERWYTLTGTAPAPEQMDVGYQLNANQSLGGRVFWDYDANGLYDSAWDDPVSGAAVAITRPDGTPVANLTASSDGSYSQTPINSGEYRVTVTHAGQSWTKDASVPLNSGVPLIDFALPPVDNRPRLLVFIDGNQNGITDQGEQRLENVSVRLIDAACGAAGAELQTVQTDTGGLVVFNPPPNGFFPVCALITAGLPVDLLPAISAGVNVPRSGGATLPLAVHPANTVQVRSFLDSNSNGSREAGETYLSGGTVTINSTTKTISSAASFYLPDGVFPVQFTPPAGYAANWTFPLSIVVSNTAQTLSIPVRDAGSISGKVWPPNNNPGTISLGGGSLAAGLEVQLQNTATSAIFETSSDNFGNFSFNNLPPATYRLRIPSPPPGYIADSEPLITYQAGNILTGKNLTLVPTGHITGVVYNDSNSNRQWDSNEPGVDDYAVRLVGNAGQEVAVATPDASGTFRFEGLTANVPYALQLVNAPEAIFINDSPGILTVGAAPSFVQLGIGVEFLPQSGNQWVGGVVQAQQGGALLPLAGARLIHYAPVNGSCTVANPLVLFDTLTDVEGNYGVQGAGGCFKVVDVPGFTASAGYGWGWCSANSAECFLGPGYYGTFIDITLNPAAPALMRAETTGSAQAAWSAFIDDNGNGVSDPGEPGLAGVTLAGGGSSGVSTYTGLGESLSLPDGLHTLTISPPAGYIVHGPETRSVSIQGVDVALAAIAVRPAGVAIFQAFIDLDGDGLQDWYESGAGGVAVSLSGAATANAVTTPDGRAMLAGLPDGSYTLTIAPPAGYAATPSRQITLMNGGAIQIPLKLPGMLSAVLFDDWDGDPQQSDDERVFSAPHLLSLSGSLGTSQLESMAGMGLFPGLETGTYTLQADTPVFRQQTISVTTTNGQGTGLAAVAPGIVRGIAWLDANQDGLRQLWESPLAGVVVALGGSLTATTDQHGRYSFANVAPGSYTLSLALPSGLQTSSAQVIIGADRGVAVGIPVVIEDVFAIYLPMIQK